MLTDSNVEEFEIKEDEPWYDQHDLQQDLQLAAELGKTLLDRNTELEESLQQMYNTNQEQFQEIEYLTKQVELLRRMNEQHAKVYEQLDITARDLENANQKLVLESRASQQKIMRYFVYDHVFAEKIASLHSQPGPLEDENSHLKKALSLLESQLSLERNKRESLEEEFSQVVKENSELEQMLRDKDLFYARAEELEAEVAEMRQICRSDSVFASSVEKLIPESIFISFKETADKEADQEVIAQLLDLNKKPLKRSNSEMLLPRVAAETILNGHEETCIRRAEATKQRGISLLNEVDSQYSALKVKYEELLQKCQLDDDGFSDQGIQTSKLSQPEGSPSKDLEPSSHKPVSAEPQPEYKVLFQEIFTCIKKTKEEIHEQRTKYKYSNAASS
ncbi:hypothetical protein XENTR_v10024020 [Xenopus tropicalis]|nr:hypothetical protein XENTR_v10024020 [Xenopus tropicalis]